MLKRFGLLSLVATAVFGQTPASAFQAPPEVEAALRARVSKFFQLHVDAREDRTKFQEAWGMVADDTKNYYFSAEKNPLAGFKLDGIRFENAEFTKAVVDVTIQQVLKRPEFPNTMVPVPKSTLWKIEKGEWVWYVDSTKAQLLPQGPSDLAALKAGGKVTAQDLHKLSDPESLLKLGQAVVQQPSGVDKQEVTLAAGKASSTEVKFHNGQPGWVDVYVNPGPEMAGFTATIDKKQVAANQDAIITISYTPVAGAASMPAQRTVVLDVEPLRRQIPVIVKFAGPEK